jgi:hypothetical protein
MTNEQHRKMLECAAKACGYEYPHMLFGGRVWNPLANGLDTAEMCAKLGIDVRWWWGSGEVECQCFFVKDITEFFAHRVSYEDHDNSRLRAWMFAATTCAAKTQGYEP